MLGGDTCNRLWINDFPHSADFPGDESNFYPMWVK